MLLGASQSSVWLQQLANTLVPGAFNAVRDGFITDGAGLGIFQLSRHFEGCICSSWTSSSKMARSCRALRL